MKNKENRGITLIALVVTIILLLILGGVVVSTFRGENIIENSLNTTEKARIESVREEIRLAIASKQVKADGEITIEQIIEELENKGITDSENSNSENGQVKTNSDGYVYEIVQDSYGNWNVNYLRKGTIEETKITLKISANTTVASNNVGITVTAKAKSGINSLQMPNGEIKKYDIGITEISENYQTTTNGTYSFIATNNNGDSITKKIEINNILEGIIQISVTPDTPTIGDVVVTINWPTGKYSTIQEISTNGGASWNNYTGSQSRLIISNNCTIKARIRNGSTEIKTATLEITNIDKNAPMVTAKQNSVTITEGDSNEIEKYFTVTSNGTAQIAAIKYINTSDNNAEINNTNTLSAGEHKIKCIATKETGATSNATITVIVQAKVKGITASEIANSPNEYYGKYVNYIVPSTGDTDVKWRIFYADTENIYLIADNCVNVQYIPQSKGEYSVGVSEGYSFNFKTIYQAYTGSVDVLNTSNDVNGRISKWLKWIVQYPASTNTNIRSVAYLLDTELWNVNYQNEYAEYAIGGPTLDLFNASYKQLHPENYIEEEIYSSNGYRVKWSSDADYSFYIEGVDTSEYEHLYIIDNSKSESYWLASTAGSSSYFVMDVNYQGSVKRSTHYTTLSIGSRPTICLKSSTQLIENTTTGMYELGL